ncbi:lipoate--protein ligase family protein [Gordonia rhizosphera]|uniref:lipoate--protein ligase family protein n=1 Tax=Gordonia rhizosphera TaxID=83341 RepID=UPI0002DA0546|nr:lipoate--protein ligase family protein [Gordonia rhizosphera]
MAVADASPFSGRTLVIREDDRPDAETHLARSVDLLRAVAAGAIAEHRVVRLSTPVPTVAMSRRESRLPGFEAAQRFSRLRGFAPAIRPTGGRAVAYDPTCIVFDIVAREREGGLGQARFFRDVGDALTASLRGLGVDARVGDVPGEYCPGEFSINARGVVKLIGTSQRAVRGARLLSGMLPLGDVGHFVDVLTEVNAALELDWDPTTFGSLGAEVHGIARTVVEDVIVAALVSPVG